MKTNVVRCPGKFVGSWCNREITRDISRCVRTVTKIVYKASSKREIIHDLLVGSYCGCRRCKTQARRRRIAAEHRICPVDTGVEHCDVHSLALVTLIKMVKWSQFLVLAINLWCSDVIDALFELDVELSVRLDLFYLRHRPDSVDGCCGHL